MIKKSGLTPTAKFSTIAFTIARAVARAIAIAGALVAPSFAQGFPAGSMELQEQSRAEFAERLQETRFDARGRELLDAEVVNNLGQRLGRIEDLLVDVYAKKVRYAVLSMDTFVGVGSRFFVFPLQPTYLSPYADAVVINVNKELLQEAPGFDRGAWPATSDPRFFDHLAEFFSEDMEPGWPSGMMRASQLIGRGVEDVAGHDAGALDDFVVDMSNGQIGFAVLRFDRMWRISDRLLPVPLEALSFPGDRESELLLNVARSELDLSVAFGDDNWPNMQAPTFRRRVETHLLALHRLTEERDDTSLQSSGTSP